MGVDAADLLFHGHARAGCGTDRIAAGWCGWVVLSMIVLLGAHYSTARSIGASQHTVADATIGAPTVTSTIRNHFIACEQIKRAIEVHISFCKLNIEAHHI